MWVLKRTGRQRVKRAKKWTKAAISAATNIVQVGPGSKKAQRVVWRRVLGLWAV
jgi:hypothetical protein